MSIDMKDKGVEPLITININGKYVLGVYQGKLSKYDLLLKYKQKDTSKRSGWTRIRTPKHIHWAVDAIIKMHYEKTETTRFIEFLIDEWDKNIKPINTEAERTALLDINKLIIEVNNEALKYPKLANKGEYSIKFLYLIAKLLMIQEKTNYSTAFMFRDLLVALKENKDIFKIVSTATHNGR